MPMFWYILDIYPAYGIFQRISSLVALKPFRHPFCYHQHANASLFNSLLDSITDSSHAFGAVNSISTFRRPKETPSQYRWPAPNRTHRDGLSAFFGTGCFEPSICDSKKPVALSYVVVLLNSPPTSVAAIAPFSPLWPWPWSLNSGCADGHGSCQATNDLAKQPWWVAYTSIATAIANGLLQRMNRLRKNYFRESCEKLVATWPPDRCLMWAAKITQPSMRRCRLVVMLQYDQYNFIIHKVQRLQRSRNPSLHLWLKIQSL